MKKLYILSILILGFMLSASTVYSQCTPDPDCTDPEGDGEYCPTEFPNAIEDVYYEQTLTVIAPVEQGGFTLHHVEVLDIGNIPPGMNYECQDNTCNFYPATPKCISIYGTPELGTWGEYNLHLTIEIFIDVVGNPLSIGTFTDSSSVVFIEPQVWGTFEVSNSDDPGYVCNNWGAFPVEYTGNASESATYYWDFGDHVEVVSGEGQGPYALDYNEAYLGLDSISLYVEDGIYTSPTHTVVFNVDYCTGGSYTEVPNISVSPNPFDGKIEINGYFMEGIIKVFDLTAKEVYSSSINSTLNQFDLSELQSGVYLISIISDKEVTTQKIVKR